MGIAAARPVTPTAMSRAPGSRRVRARMSALASGRWPTRAMRKRAVLAPAEATPRRSSTRRGPPAPGFPTAKGHASGARNRRENLRCPCVSEEFSAFESRAISCSSRKATCVERLAGSPRSDWLARALTALGRMVKGAYILRPDQLLTDEAVDARDALHPFLGMRGIRRLGGPWADGRRSMVSDYWACLPRAPEGNPSRRPLTSE